MPDADQKAARKRRAPQVTCHLRDAIRVERTPALKRVIAVATVQSNDCDSDRRVVEEVKMTAGNIGVLATTAVKLSVSICEMPKASVVARVIDDAVKAQVTPTPPELSP